MKKLAFLIGAILLAGLAVWFYAAFMLGDASPAVLPVETETPPTQVLEPDPLSEDLTEIEEELDENTDEAEVLDNVFKTGNELILAKENFTPGTDSPKPLVRKAKELISQNKFREALDIFVQADGQESDQVTQYYIGIINAYLGQRDLAKEYLQKAVLTATHPKTTQYASNFLKVYEYFDTFQGAGPEFLDTLIAKELLASGEFEIAVDKLQFITSTVTDYVDAWVLLGSAYLVQGQYQEATSTLDKVLPSQRAEVYYWLGLAYYYQNDLSKAIAAYTQALRKGYQPRYRLYEKIADIYLDKGNYEKAAQNYALALEQDEAKYYIDLYVRPVWLYNDVLNNPSQGLFLAEQALTYHPEHAMAYNLVGWSYLSLQDYEQAKFYLKKGKELDPNLAAIYLNLGRYFEAVGEIQNAIDNYEDALRLDPEGAIGKSAGERSVKLVTSE
ncbi:MAG: tetratricopeptide repeat protein [Candidatus Gracilibacteria bacterium]|nr:tetratricopeptide repeat protein [Candidatus Gracilibacteria bacterium]